MSAVAYYDENGNPRANDGTHVIIMDFNSDLSPLPDGILSNVSVAPKEYQNARIYTLPASYINRPRVGGKVAVDKSKLPVVIPIASFFQSNKEIDGKITKSQSIMVKDLISFIHETNNVLNNVTEANVNKDLEKTIQKQKDALKSLEQSIAEINQLESEIENKQKIAEQRFNNFLARKDVRLTNFKKFIDQGKYSAFHGGLMSVISIMRHIPKVWQDEVVKPNDEIVFLKNKKLELTNKINIITDDMQKTSEIIDDNIIDKEKDLKQAIQFTSNFYQEVFSAYGEKAQQLAKELAKKTEGKKIHNIDDAMKAFEKYKDILNKKFSLKDRQAINNALKSLKYDSIAKNFIIFGKAFSYTGKAMDAYELYQELIKANETDNWRPFFVKAETLAVNAAASFLTAFTFAILLGNPISILGYAFIIAIVGMLIDDELIEKANQLIGI